MSKSFVFILIIILYATDHVHIYNFWYNSISFKKDKISSIFTNRSLVNADIKF